MRICLLGLVAWLVTSVSVSSQTIARVTPQIANGTLTATNDGSCTATGTGCVVLSLGGYTGVGVQVTGTCGTCTLAFESTVDGTNWVATTLVTAVAARNQSTTSIVGVWYGSVVAQYFRVRMTARSSGSFVVTTRATLGVTARQSGNVVLYAESISVANAGDTNYVKTSTYTLPANTMIKVGDRLIIEAVAVGSSATSSRAYQCGVGFTSWASDATGFVGGETILSNASSTASITYHIRGWVTYLNSTGAESAGLSVVGTSFQASALTTRAFDWRTDLNIACQAKDATGNAAAITLREFRVLFEPAP